MGDNHEQEDADLAAMNDDDDDDDDTLLEVTYRGDRLVNIPNVPFRLIIHASVTEIDMCAFEYCTTLIEVVFHNKVTGIGFRAFAGCSNLQPIELPAGLLRVAQWAFDGCTSLRGEIVIPASVQYMGDLVFEGCTSVESVIFAHIPPLNAVELRQTLSNRQQSVALSHDLQSEIISFAATIVVKLGYGMFRCCSSLWFVTLPQDLHSIPARFFYKCTSLTRLQIPVSVEEIGVEALYGSGILSIHVPEQVHRIRSGAFKNCAFLERITFHSPDLNLANDIFVNCPLLSTIMIAPWLWSTLFASMKEHPDFIFNFFRKYQKQILDVETPDVRPFRRLRRDRKRTAMMMDD